MAIRISINQHTDTPVYRQIKESLAGDIRSGLLPAGTRLPSTRDLAKQLKLNRITVANAYAELQGEGLIYGKSGSGTYVSPGQTGSTAAQPSVASMPLWQKRLTTADRSGALPDNAHAPVSETDVISFASGMGAEELFPADDYRKALQSILQQDRGDALGYGDLAGYYPLRVTISNYLAAQGIASSPEAILITSGSQQAMNLVSRLLLRPGDSVLVEDPTYSSALDLFNSLDAAAVPLTMDNHGLKTDLLEEALRTVHPALIYTIPNFHNPTGICLSNERRRQLVQLAQTYNIPILEDEFAGDLRYDGKPRPALKALDLHGNVIYTGTFSKILMPGLRIGYLVAHGPVYQQLLLSKQVNDLSTSELIQRALNEYITTGRYDVHLGRARRMFRYRRNLMGLLLNRHMPAGCAWQLPQGGLFIWLKLPDGVRASALETAARQQKVAFAAGTQFSHTAIGEQHIRLNFTSLPPERVEEGVKRLAKAIKSLRS